jgi:hypothetical protein
LGLFADFISHLLLQPNATATSIGSGIFDNCHRLSQFLSCHAGIKGIRPAELKDSFADFSTLQFDAESKSFVRACALPDAAIRRGAPCGELGMRSA